MMATLFDIDHEAGDLSEYDSTVTDGGDLSVSASAALASTNYGLECLVDDTTTLEATKNVTAPASGQIRYRFYIDPNGLSMDDADAHYIQTLSSDPGTLARVQFRTSSGNYQVRLVSYHDDNSTETTAYTTITDAPHYIEVQVTRATGAATHDGTSEIWIDGVSAGSENNLDNYDDFAAMDAFIVGAGPGLDAGTSGTFYIDQIVATDDATTEIGAYTPPAGSTGPLTDHHYRTRRA